MGVETIADEALRAHLKDNPCRGIVLGMSRSGNPTQISWIMGRSANSQNRVYEQTADGELRTRAFNPSKVEDPSLIIYPAMMHDRAELHYAVSNGAQTEAALRAVVLANMGKKDDAFMREMSHWHCEPDAPTFTPRITGYFLVDSNAERLPACISVLVRDEDALADWLGTIKRDGLEKEQFRRPGLTGSQVLTAFNEEVSRRSGLDYLAFPTERYVHHVTLTPGTGFCVTTYRPGSKALDPFQGAPLEVPIMGSPKHTLRYLWDALEPGPDAAADPQKDWRVAIAVKSVDVLDGPKYTVHNRHEAR